MGAPCLHPDLSKHNAGTWVRYINFKLAILGGKDVEEVGSTTPLLQS